MIYQLFPGCDMPYLVEGDTLVIFEREFTYRGEFNTTSELPNIVGVYYIRDLGQFNLRHYLHDSDIAKAYADYSLANLSKKEVVIRERIHKEAFVVPISDSDNYLKVLIKKILYKEQIDIRTYKDRFNNDDNYMNNMKRLITGRAKLTYDKFQEWLDILHYSHIITLYDELNEEFNYDM